MSNEQSRNNILKRYGSKLAFLVFDVIAVNAAYLLAIYIRFYMHSAFFESAETIYIPAFRTFAPFYTIACIAVFFVFKLYSSLWRYAGINDLNRIIYANIVTCVIQIVGSILFVQRMPISYYGLGAMIQLILIFVSRFSYRFFAIEGSKMSKDKAESTVNVMVVGIGESAKILIRQLEKQGDNVAKPVCVIDYRGHDDGYLFDGIPVIATLDGMRKGIEKYNVKSVIIADSLMPGETREKIRTLCNELKVDIQDFSGYNQESADGLPMFKLMEYVNGPVQVIMDGIPLDYDNGEAAVMALHDKYLVKSISAEKNRLVIEVERDKTVMNNINDTWVHEYEDQTGEKISFF